MYFFESSLSRAPLHALTVGSGVSSVILLSISSIDGVPFPMIFQLVAILCAAAAVYLCTRYSLRIYRYAVEPNGIVDADGVEQYDLVVSETVGQKSKIVARVGLRDIGDIAVVRRRDKAARAAAKTCLCKDRQIFRYANVPVMTEECYISVPEEAAVLIIPADERMAAILRGTKEET